MSTTASVHFVRSSDQQEVANLLEKAGLSGFVLSPENGWVPVVTPAEISVADASLVSVTREILVYCWCSEDFGWGFTLLEDGKPVSRYALDLESEECVDASDFDLDCAVRLLGSGDDRATRRLLREILLDVDLEELEEGIVPLADRFSNDVLGVGDFNYLEYDSLRGEAQERGGVPPLLAMLAINVPGVQREVSPRADACSESPEKAPSSASSAPDERLLGSWQCIEVTSGGFTQRFRNSDMIWRFEPDRLIFSDLSRKSSSFQSYTAYPDQEPVRLIIHEDDPPDSCWIYKFDGDRLVVCRGGTRDPPPTRFDGSNESPYYVEVFRRVPEQ